MATHYQVNTEFKLNHGKPLLKSVIYHNTKSAVTTLPIYSSFSCLKTYRIFHTLQEAKQYMNYLMNVYKNKNTSPPVFKCGQLNLFKE